MWNRVPRPRIIPYLEIQILDMAAAPPKMFLLRNKYIHKELTVLDFRLSYLLKKPK